MKEIFHRASIRKYLDREVEKEKIDAILQAAMAAPSAVNQRPWEFYLVKNKDVLQKLAKASPYAGMVAQAPVAIVLAYRENCTLPDYAQIDCSIAMENIWLETDFEGLGGVWLGIAPVEERMKNVEKILNIPQGQRAFSIFAFGYPAEEKVQKDRFEPERVHVIE